MNKSFKIIFISVIFLISIYSALAEIDLMSFEANIFDSNGGFK